MPMIIHPKVSGTVVIEMSIAEAKVLVDALDRVLKVQSFQWVDKTLRDHTIGETCDMFLAALKGGI